MKKLALALCFVAGTANAASSLKQICTDYTKYLGHVYGFAVSEDESMRKLLLADMKRLNLSEAMVQKELYKATTDDAAKMYYAKFLNPDLNDTNRAAFNQMITYCEAGPDMMIPSWPVLVAKGKVRKEDAGKSINTYIQSDEFMNSRGMRHQKVEGTLESRARGNGVSPDQPIEYSSPTN
ncbi:simA domain protein [Salmonella enterica]|nr:simA domain protein [Salmonella enterica subsp. enterica serovar Senftenberg]EEO4790955.1 simA domain protein [Salmonella enterica]EEO4853217.1 simA domain protein [Salmonella enterica]